MLVGYFPEKENIIIKLINLNIISENNRLLISVSKITDVFNLSMNLFCSYGISMKSYLNIAGCLCNTIFSFRDTLTSLNNTKQLF